MTGNEFKELALEEQISYVNTQLEQGVSLRQLFENLGLNRSGETRRFEKAGYRYDKEERRYYSSDTKVIDLENKSNTPVTEKEHKSNVTVIEKKHKSNTEVTQKCDESNTKVIPEGIDWVILREMIEKYKQGNLSGEVRTFIINPAEFKGNITAKTMKLYTGVLADFQDFANQYAQYSFQDLHNMALVEFMKKYGKQ